MKRLLKLTVLAMVAAAAVVYVAGRRPSQAAAADVAAADPHAEHMMTMTPEEHVKMMAASGNIHANHALDEFARGVAQGAPVNLKLPADDMGVVARLAASPRKGEYVTITVDGKPMRTWVVHPAGNGKATVVVVIQEIFGLSDWIRGVADQLAAEGFIAVAPDLVAGHGKDGGDTSSLTTQQEITAAVLQLPAAEITAKLEASRAFGMKDSR